MLTELGQQQQFELGQMIRVDYIEKHKLLDETLNKNQIKVVAASNARCYESAQWQLLGMYPLRDMAPRQYKHFAR